MNLTSDVARVPGWYGKLPSLGDFASRRLEADFIEPWDLWLGEGLQAQRGTFGDGWLDAYNDTPPWRFVLSPGALRGVRPELAFAGVLVPSVDRVGRHFPLTIVASMARPPGLAAEFDAVLAWLHRLEDTALDALQGDWTIDELEDALADFGLPGDEGSRAVEDRLTAVRRAVGEAMTRRGGFVDLAGVSSRADLAAIFSAPAAAPPAPRPPMRGLALWIADAPGKSQLLVSDGLPGVEEFVRMFSGGGGARPAGHAGQAQVEAEDPLATRPMGLGPPLAAGAAHAADDLLSMFGGSASAAPAGELFGGSASAAPAVELFGGSASAAPPAELFGSPGPTTPAGAPFAGPAPTAPPAEPSPPRELLPDDDILALFKVGGDPASGPLDAPAAAIPEQDVLGLYAPATAPAPAPDASAEQAPAGAPARIPDDDILALFSATDSHAGELAGEPPPAKDELLGMFEVPPETLPFGEAPPAAASPRHGDAGAPDILDMFGIPPAKQEGKEAK